MKVEGEGEGEGAGELEGEGAGEGEGGEEAAEDSEGDEAEGDEAEGDEAEGDEAEGGKGKDDEAEEDKKRRPGYFSIDSSPWARIYVDGRELGVTPIFKKRLPAGRHRVKAVSATGAIKRFSVRVRPGRTATVPRLRWE